MQIKNLLYIGFILKKLKRSQSHFSDSDSMKRSDSVSLLRSLLIGWLGGFWERATGRSAAAPGGSHHILYFTWYYQHCSICFHIMDLDVSPFLPITFFYSQILFLWTTRSSFMPGTRLHLCSQFNDVHRWPFESTGFQFSTLQKSGILYFRLNWNRTEVFDITMSSLQNCEVNQSDTVVSKAIQKEICSDSFMQKENPF